MKILKKLFSKEVYALSVLSGTIIGVGIFSLPYITTKVGVWVMAGYFLILGAIVILIHYFFGEISLKTPDFLRLPGFAKIYLGNKGKLVALFEVTFGLLGAILAYLIVGGEFLRSLLSPVFGGGTLIYTLFYFVVGATLIYFGTQIISKVEFWGLILFFVVLILIFFRAQFHSLLQIENLFLVPEPGNLFLPYGVVLFSFWGAALIPETEEILGEDKEKLKKIIPIAILIPILVSIFFMFMIVGITGPETTESALIGLRKMLGNGLVSLVLFFGLITTFTSFIALGLTLKKVFWYDLKVKKTFSWAIACFVPLILFLAGLQSFIEVISVVGGIMLGVEGILILLMYKKLFPQKHRFLIFPLMLILFVGMVYEIIYFVK